MLIVIFIVCISSNFYKIVDETGGNQDTCIEKSVSILETSFQYVIRATWDSTLTAYKNERSNDIYVRG